MGLRIGLLLASMSCAAVARAEPPPHQVELAAWAEASGYTLGAWSNCAGLEERAFGAQGSVCWTARRKTPNPGTREHPRLALELAVYAEEAAAQRRMARFHELPKLTGEAEKAYPLRAAFRLGTRVLVLTTDARLFEPDLYRAAQELAAKLGGTELTCWMGCGQAQP